MAYTIRRADYFYAKVPDQPGGACKLLSQFAEHGISLLAFTAVPVGPLHTQLSLFPEDAGKTKDLVNKAGLDLDGPYPALLVQGDDELGALAGIHERLSDAGVNVFASSGVAAGSSFGYVLYVRPEKIERAMSALEL